MAVPLNVYKWGPDWVIARSTVDCAFALMDGVGYGAEDLEEMLEEEPKRLADDVAIRVTIDRDDLPETLPDGVTLEDVDEWSVKATAAVRTWLKVFGRGLLCSENF